MSSGPRVLLVAGEVSGDWRGAELVDELRRLVPEVRASDFRVEFGI